MPWFFTVAAYTLKASYIYEAENNVRQVKLNDRLFLILIIFNRNLEKDV